MTTFDEREQAYENKFVRDAEILFMAEVRANKYLGLWAASVLGKSGPAAQDYASSVIKEDFKTAGHTDVIDKLVRDLSGDFGARRIRDKRRQYLAQAKSEFFDPT